MNENEIKEKFEEIYKAKIEPNLSMLESYRIEEKKKYDLGVKFLILSIIITIVIPILGANKIISDIIIFPVFIIGMILAVCTGFYTNKISKDFRKKIKPVLLKPVLSIFGNFRLADRELISLGEIKSMGLYHSARHKKDDDNIVGMYKDTPVEFVDTKLTHSSGGENSSSITDFNGLIIKVRMDKTFEGITIGKHNCNLENLIKLAKNASMKHPELYPPEKLKWLDNPILRTVGEAQKFMSENRLSIRNGKLFVDIFGLASKNNVKRQLEKVLLEDPEFNETYTVYSDNQVESRYILTPTFMEKLKSIHSTFLVMNVDFVIKENLLYLFLGGSAETLDMTSRDSSENGFFEVGDISKTILNKNIYLKLFRELIAIFSLISLFKSNDKTL